VQHAEGEAKSESSLAWNYGNYGLEVKRLAEAQKLVEEHLNEIRRARCRIVKTGGEPRISRGLLSRSP
jgi:hypothetical protein